MNITIALLRFVSSELLRTAGDLDAESEEHEVLTDAADAVADAADMLEDLG